jgi:glycosyltransferase involved in cell wall biosynthesis
MKIAFFQNLPAGGAKKVVLEQIKYLSKKHEVVLYQIGPDDPYFPFNNFVSTIHRYNFPIADKLPKPIARLNRDISIFFRLAALHKTIAKDIDKMNYNIIVVHPDQYTQAPFLLRYLKTKNIYYSHEWLRIVYEPAFFFKEEVLFTKKIYENLTRKLRKSIDKKNTIAADHIIANSRYTANNIKRAYGRNADVCYPGVDVELFFPHNTRKKYDILFVGDKTETEGVDILQEIEKIFLKKLNIKIISRKNGGYSISDKELAKEYNYAKVVVCLSINEPFGLIPLEAMACGTPVVAIADGGYKETIVDGHTGFLVLRDAKLIAAKIDYILSNEQVRLNMDKNAFRYIKKNWTWTKSMKQLEETFSRLHV